MTIQELNRLHLVETDILSTYMSQSLCPGCERLTKLPVTPNPGFPSPQAKILRCLRATLMVGTLSTDPVPPDANLKCLKDNDAHRTRYEVLEQRDNYRYRRTNMIQSSRRILGIQAMTGVFQQRSVAVFDRPGSPRILRPGRSICLSEHFEPSRQQSFTSEQR